MIVLSQEGIAMDGPTNDILGNPKIETYGVPMPQVAKMAHKLQEQNKRSFDPIPTKLDESVVAFRKVLNLNE